MRRLLSRYGGFAALFGQSFCVGMLARASLGSLVEQDVEFVGPGKSNTALG